ncbi:hypothetical protein KMC80_gp14 [Lactococcus phage 37203]|uniref:Uncharacterized protein n=3 Tax=Ceduovirus TaxID=186532 RepID=A0A2Z2RUW0_9CAUD|nr:hypothetical protein KMC80_gp14 [Lactococcus phage 37203]YP_010080633.1 hypothetical protein KMC82_gp15 [Lactococcus phage 50504]ASZ70762.1 hypothetical protein 37203_14 [Lactococcus phage 37203]ASZ70800.1 hypothetical protein 74001_14 [Lactococcus phage 74001]ASZ70839.1 hypothetical protein 50504_15 [Lactococcus phage 50504]
MAIEKVVYYYDDGTKREYPPRLTDLEQLEEFRKSKADVTDVYDFMQEHLSKFEAKLSLCFKYMVDNLGMEEQQANNTLEFWCDEWGVQNVHVIADGRWKCQMCGKQCEPDKVFCSEECYKNYIE